MKKNFFTIMLGAAVLIGLLTTCRGKVTISGTEGSDTIEFNTDSVREINIDVQTNDYEEGEADESEALGMAPYEEELMDISEMPKTAVRQDSHFQTAVYVNVEHHPTEDGEAGIYSVWLADERVGTVRKILTTNPTAAPEWEKMNKENSNAVEVPLHLVATAEKAYLAPGDVSKIIVEGCPDGRNTWTYIIDTDTRTAKQFPSTEGVQSRDWNKKEIILASYGYYPAPDFGRYTYNRAYSLDGKFLRVASKKVPE
ncbi:MAG: hypothetical protein J5616_02270 [Bacteroidaceae bacterium]|nr:hypothetical protein [Bacteroidaceae bacterium]